MANDTTRLQDQQTLSPGTYLFNNTYRIERVIGRGGFGITYLGYNENLDVAVAIKEFFPKGMYNRDYNSTTASVASHDNADLAERLKTKFIKEARRIARLRHESIVGVSNTFEENGTAYYVMDYIKGRDLHELVKGSGPLSIDRAVRYIKQVGEALTYLHNQRINHLDVKPANILVDESTGRAVLIDFGLSKQYDEGGHQTSTTPVGVSHGYAPLEQYRSGGVQEFSAQTDVYSLGATLYYLLTGERPPEAMALGDEVMIFPASIPEYIQTAIIRAMKPQRADRYPTVTDFLAAIDRRPLKTRINSVSTKGEVTDKSSKLFSTTKKQASPVKQKLDVRKKSSSQRKILLIILLGLTALCLGIGIIYFVLNGDKKSGESNPVSLYKIYDIETNSNDDTKKTEIVEKEQEENNNETLITDYQTEESAKSAKEEKSAETKTNNVELKPVSNTKKESPSNVIEKGDRFTVTFTVKDFKGERSDLNLPDKLEIKGCRMLYGPSIATVRSMKIVNGKQEEEFRYDIRYTFVHEENGEIVVPTIRINDGGVYKTITGTISTVKK